MKKNGSGIDRRLAFLEKVYLEDCERWRKSEARWEKNEARWEKNDRTVVVMLKAIQAQNGELKRQGARIDFAMKALHRLMEQEP